MSRARRSKPRAAPGLGDLLLRARAYIDPTAEGTQTATRPPQAPPSPAETALLALASDVAALAPDLTPGALVSAALSRIATAFAPPSPLGAPPARGDAERLAIAWAREQARLALADVVDRVAKAGALRLDAPADVLAWLLLAAGAALAHEAPDDAGDRLAALVDVIVVPDGRR